MQDLSDQQTRQLIDAEQLYSAYRSVEQELRARFAGSMSWKTVKGHRYLYRKSGDVWTSLGPQNGETEEAFRRFRIGRRELRERKQSLDQRLRSMAPVNRALRLGRVPTPAAGLIRKLDRLGLLGHGLKIAGTHAVYAYERMGGVHFGQAAVATQDVDLLYDARTSLNLAGPELKDQGLIGILKDVDSSFRPLQKGSYRAVNDKGFMVDLITPATRNPATRRSTGALSGVRDDLKAVEIAGLSWLENSPSVSQVVLDESGYPLTIVAPDPRSFVCHKAWLSSRDDREPLKRRRDLAQAQTVARMLGTRLPHLSFDDPALKAIPAELLRLGASLAAAQEREFRGGTAQIWDA